MSAPSTPDHGPVRSLSRELSHDRPVPRALVHKTGPGEVFLTDFVQTDEDRFLLAGELPRSHAFYGDSASATPGIDPMTLLELGRQSGYVVLHDHFGIALENTFVMRSMGAGLAPGAASLAFDEAVQLHIELWLERPYHRDGTLVGFLGHADVRTVDGTPIGDVTASFSWITHEFFRAFRAGTRETLGLPAQPPEPAWSASPSPVRAYGRRSVRNALLAEPVHRGDATTAYLRPDLTYVSLFDHAYDHVPGMVQTEGCKQLAVLGAAHRLGLDPGDVVPARLDARFDAINEVDFETLCTATFSPGDESGGLHAVVHAEQDGRSLGEVRVLVVPRG